MHALRVLEYPAIKARLEHLCETPLSAAWASELLPSFDRAEVVELLATTQEAYEALSKHSMPSLGSIKDLREALLRAEKGGVLGGLELRQVGDSLATMRRLRTFLEARKEDFPRLAPFRESLPEQPKLESNLLESLETDGTLLDSASPALALLRQKKKSAASRVQERIQSYATGRTRELLSDPIYTMRDGRYVIPLKAENRGKIRGIVHDSSASGQTIYLEPEDVLQMGNALREIEAQERAEEARILASLSAKVGVVAAETSGGILAASRVDLFLAKARLGFEMKGTMPVVKTEAATASQYLHVQGGRHPLLDREKAMPLDLVVGQGNSVLITGPNTGGKTVAIKTVGLFILMAQSGLMPPALDVRLGPFTQVWADIGDEQSLEQSLSTFSGHIKNIAEALKYLKRGAIVLLDEVGAGTDPAEGAALAKAMLESMASRGATVLASTHYGELKAFAYNTEGFTNAAMEFDPKSLRPTYRLLMGAPGASQALRIAERYGIPKEVVEVARESLGEEAQGMALMLERLETSQRQARIAQSEADRRASELKKAEDRAARKLAEAEEIRKNAHAKAHEVIEAALREIRLEATRLFDQLKQKGDDRSKEQVRQGLRELDKVGRDFALEFVPKAKPKGTVPDLKKGMLVRMEGYTQTGTVLDAPKDGKVNVQMGMLKMSVAVSRLEIVDKPSAVIVRAKPNARLNKATTASIEIDLRHMRAEEAMRDLERFVDDAVLAGLPSIRIMHGKGEGILRRFTQDYLKRTPAVASFRDGEPAEGGAGVTVATFE